MSTKTVEMQPNLDLPADSIRESIYLRLQINESHERFVQIAAAHSVVFRDMLGDDRRGALTGLSRGQLLVARSLISGRPLLSAQDVY